MWCSRILQTAHPPHGIKVMLEDRQVGRVQAVLDASAPLGVKLSSELTARESILPGRMEVQNFAGLAFNNARRFNGLGNRERFPPG